jgi:hypothetical protein
MAEFIESEASVGTNTANGLATASPPPRPKARTAKQLQKAIRSHSKLAAIEPFLGHGKGFE